MNIVIYTKISGKCPVKEFIEELNSIDKARVLACLKSVEDLGFDCPRVQFRQIQGQLWEIKVRITNGGIRIFYAVFKSRTQTIALLHAYKKQSHKAPRKEIEIAEQRMFEVLNNEDNYN